MERPHGTPPAVSERWEDFMADLEATAEEYREAGYETLAIHTGDVTPLPDDVTLDVLAPGDEYERLQEFDAEFDAEEFEVYSATEGEMTFALVAALDHDRERAVLCPIFYHHSVADTFGDLSAEAGGVRIQVRPLSDESRVTFTLADPDLLF